LYFRELKIYLPNNNSTTFVSTFKNNIIFFGGSIAVVALMIVEIQTVDIFFTSGHELGHCLGNVLWAPIGVFLFKFREGIIVIDIRGLYERLVRRVEINSSLKIVEITR
jgi:hypothetical protein